MVGVRDESYNSVQRSTCHDGNQCDGHSRGVGSTCTPRSVLAVAADGGVDNTRIARRDVLVSQPEGGQGAGAEILHDDVGLVA